MRLKISRFIAIIILVIPGLMATTGFLMMKDALFLFFSMHGSNEKPIFDWLHFAGGLILFAAGIAFLAGWVLFRDRKRNYVAPRFKEKRKAQTS
ncbi:DUF2627 domain-containing protein [Paenibacillus sediminis]|uniref:DUF2627 domain-containing protein n=1 Tax=Paenibacillus sediminis TaxID=664909 RepID=A0ABS4GZI6_9BACL|nr:DUF2627 domain-containing protein [Paenibacillus sediminis]MBP1935683.1 hypothetical protein [Paenibacillus sediminis]